MSSNGYTLYRGPSAFNGKPIKVVVTGTKHPSNNPKTGPMLQVWILPDGDDPPNKQVSICGTCPIRKACYVNWGQAPTSVWRAEYPDFWENPLFLENIRLGASGDPAAIPAAEWNHLTHYFGQHVGYTHAWQWAEHLRPWCMASTETWNDTFDAWELGWRTFRVIPESDRPRLVPGGMEKWCNSLSGDQCIECMRCHGQKNNSERSIVIPAHGSRKGNL